MNNHRKQYRNLKGEKSLGAVVIYEQVRAHADKEQLRSIIGMGKFNLKILRKERSVILSYLIVNGQI